MRQDAPELTTELVADGVVPSQPAISPDGCWVAYVVAPAGRKAFLTNRHPPSAVPRAHYRRYGAFLVVPAQEAEARRLGCSARRP